MSVAVLILLAGAMGAGGVALAAAGAHAVPGAGLDGAAYMLLLHAAAVLGGTAILQQGVLWRPLMLAALAGWVAGSALFSGDIALRAFAGHRLFPMAAPAGGIILIAAWLALAACGLAALTRIGVGKGCDPLPALRTARAVFPHTALQSVVVPHRECLAASQAVCIASSPASAKKALGQR